MLAPFLDVLTSVRKSANWDLRSRSSSASLLRCGSKSSANLQLGQALQLRNATPSAFLLRRSRWLSHFGHEPDNRMAAIYRPRTDKAAMSATHRSQSLSVRPSSAAALAHSRTSIGRTRISRRLDFFTGHLVRALYVRCQHSSRVNKSRASSTLLTTA